MSQNRGFYVALTIFLIPILVITLSTAWYYLGFGPKTKVNYGDLLEPTLYLGELDLELDYQYLDIDRIISGKFHFYLAAHQSLFL